MQDTPPMEEAGSTNGAVGVVRRDEAVAAEEARPVPARSIRESSPPPWITVTAPR